jgi:hypothetical protein
MTTRLCRQRQSPVYTPIRPLQRRHRSGHTTCAIKMAPQSRSHANTTIADRATIQATRQTPLNMAPQSRPHADVPCRWRRNLSHASTRPLEMAPPRNPPAFQTGPQSTVHAGTPLIAGAAVQATRQQILFRWRSSPIHKPRSPLKIPPQSRS